MPRFVILTHDHPYLHWDLLLEQEESLKSWRILKEPDSQTSLEVEPLPDHRMMYLDYEGSVSGNRGTVSQWDKGEFEWISKEEDFFEFLLKGSKLNAKVIIQKQGDQFIINMEMNS